MSTYEVPLSSLVKSINLTSEELFNAPIMEKVSENGFSATKIGLAAINLAKWKITVVKLGNGENVTLFCERDNVTVTKSIGHADYMRFSGETVTISHLMHILHLMTRLNATESTKKITEKYVKYSLNGLLVREFMKMPYLGQRLSAYSGKVYYKASVSILWGYKNGKFFRLTEDKWEKWAFVYGYNALYVSVDNIINRKLLSTVKKFRGKFVSINELRKQKRIRVDIDTRRAANEREYRNSEIMRILSAPHVVYSLYQELEKWENVTQIRVQLARLANTIEKCDNEREFNYSRFSAIVQAYSNELPKELTSNLQKIATIWRNSNS